MKHLPITAILPIAILAGVYIGISPAILGGIGVDLNNTYLIAARGLLAGLSPYESTSTFRNPVWALIPFLPLANLPYNVVVAIFLTVTLSIYIFIALKLKASPISFAAFFLSPPVICALHTLNIDVFILLGFILPAPIGLFLVLLKPQIGVGMAVYWLIEAWRKGGIKQVVITFAPVTICLGITFAVYGNWLNLAGNAELIHASWNFSIFPWGIPAGIILLLIGIVLKNKLLAGSASPFLSPYVALYSWPTALAGLFQNKKLMVVVVFIMWVLVLIRPFLP